MNLNRIDYVDGNKRGVSIIAVTLLMTGLAVMSLALVSTVGSSGSAQRGANAQVRARYVAEAGLSVAMMDLENGVAAGELNLGSEEQPMSYGSASYWIDAVDLGNGLYDMTSTGVENNVGAQLQLVVRAVPEDVPRWAAFGDEELTFHGNAQVDSYDSSVGSYEDQITAGGPVNGYARSHGQVATNGNISADGHAWVFGDAMPGPGGTVSLSGAANVTGSTVPATSLVELATIEVPHLASMGDMDFDGAGTGPFASYIPSGSYHLGDVEVDVNSLIIVGPATLVFDSLEVKSNSEIWIDATDGPVEIFVLEDFKLNSNTLMAATDLDPANLSIKLLANNRDGVEGDDHGDDDHGDDDHADDDHADDDHADDDHADDDHADDDHADDDHADDDHADDDHADDDHADDDHADDDHGDDDHADDDDGSDGDDVDLSSNVQVYGTFYAPTAYLEIGANFELFGSLMALRINMANDGRLHFDEALLDAGPETEIVFETVGWKLTPYHK